MTDLEKNKAKFSNINEAINALENMKSEARETINRTESRLVDILIKVANKKVKGAEIDALVAERLKAQEIERAVPIAISELSKEKEEVRLTIGRLSAAESKAMDAAKYIPLRDEVINRGDCDNTTRRELNRYAHAAGKRDEFDRLIYELEDYNRSYYKRKDGEFTFKPDPV